MLILYHLIKQIIIVILIPQLQLHLHTYQMILIIKFQLLLNILMNSPNHVHQNNSFLIIILI